MSTLREKLMTALGQQLPGANIVNEACETALDTYLRNDSALARSVLWGWTKPHAIVGIQDDVALEDICKKCTSPTKAGSMCDLQNAIVNGIVDRDLRAKTTST